MSKNLNAIIKGFSIAMLLKIIKFMFIDTFFSIPKIHYQYVISKKLIKDGNEFP